MGIGNMVRALLEKGTRMRWIRYHMLSYRNGQPYEIGETWVREGQTTFTFGGGKYDAWERGYEKRGRLHCLVGINKKEPIDLGFTTSKGGIDPTRYKTETDNKVFRAITLGGKESMIWPILVVVAFISVIVVVYILTNNLKAVQAIASPTPPVKVG